MYITFLLLLGFYSVTCRRREIIMNLPESVSVPENSAGGTLVYELMLSDPFNTEYNFHFEPPEGADIFEINHGSHSVFIKHGAQIDYETQSEYKIEFIPFQSTPQNGSAVLRKKRVADDPVNYVLHINITNVNEPPIFSSETYIFYVSEGPAKTLLKNISFAATDPDDNDVISFSLTSVSDNLALKRFSIDPHSGAVRFAVDYEVDNGAMAETVVLYVNAHDSSHLMDTALVIIHVSDINDNSPSFSQDSYTIFVPLGLPMKTSILNLTATDPDQGLGGVRRIYESKTLNSPCFDIAMETRDAMNVSVYVSKELDVNDTQIMAVVAVDGYGLEGTASVTISILGSVTYTYSLSEGLGTQHSNQQNCCCTDVQKLTWMIPFLVIMCTLLLAILIIITRKRSKVGKMNNND